MTSTAASSIQKSFKYDVFLSFRGEDTRKNFVDHLYFALKQKGINTYKDNENIEKGKRIDDQLSRSIEDSRFYIIVFSKNYASSSWCLDELAKIMECQNEIEHIAYSIFYDVEPTEVRHQSGAVKDAFAEHVEKEAAGRWKNALKEAADLAGWELKTTVDGHEAQFIQKIVTDISKKLQFIKKSVDEKLVGMDHRVKKIISSLEIGSSNVRVLMIGIKGMGGSGKTTLARAVFDHIFIKFDGVSFVENVREVSKGSSSGLKELQKQVLSDVLNDQSIVVTGVSDGIHKMKWMMGGRKVLVVLDDVDDTKQLEALAGSLDWFKPGSRIIITTRDNQVLSHEVQKGHIHNVSPLSDEEAIFLLSKYAFRREIPNQEYRELSREVVRYADGVPLAIKLLGSFLRDKTEHQWKDAIEKLKTNPFKGIMETLELSYVGLEDDEQQIFLDVACILKGEQKEEAIKILESCGYHAHIGLEVLEQKSLISISDTGCLHLHDRIEEMGKDIVRRVKHDEPEKHSRLWVTKEIEDIFNKDMGTEATGSIKLEYSDLHPVTIMKGLRKMKGLRYLYVDGEYHKWKINEAGQYLPDTLQSLRWPEYPFLCLPKNFEANMLVNLEMPFSNISQLWEGGERKDLNNLTFPFCCLPETFNLQIVWSNISELWQKREKKVLSKLRFLDLKFSKLRTFDLGLTPHLERLDLRGCNGLLELHMAFECPKLKFLNLGGSKLSNFNLELTPYLETLDLGGCKEFAELLIPVICPKLKFLNLSGSKLSKLNLELTPHLETLVLRGCKDFVELLMPVICPKIKFLYLTDSKVSKLNLELIPHLEWLDLKECYCLVEIHAPVGCLKRLVHLNLSGCSRFKIFLVDTQHESAGFDSVATLELTAESLDKCPRHPNSNLPKLQFECNFDEPLPSSSGNLEKLISFGVCACTNLESFSASICGLQKLGKLSLKGSIPEVPKDLYRLEILEELTLSIKHIKNIPDSICSLKHLKSLKLNSCWHLEQLPKDLGRLEILEELHITDSISLLGIPNSICNMKSLKYLHLPYCSLVEMLPEELGRLERLKELNIEGTAISRLPLSISRMKGLCIVWSRVLLELHHFMSLRNVSKYTASCYV
ncbi:TMV resistance protein N-like [Bidens hawaiensis]|uniref:TMV resistance protein N-like n=1 Tax=Bidens hawaiensis TaxID=980011 RepID=UPI00404B912A